MYSYVFAGTMVLCNQGGSLVSGTLDAFFGGISIHCQDARHIVANAATLLHFCNYCQKLSYSELMFGVIG